jgi:hypothetical protein
MRGSRVGGAEHRFLPPGVNHDLPVRGHGIASETLEAIQETGEIRGDPGVYHPYERKPFLEGLTRKLTLEGVNHHITDTSPTHEEIRGGRGSQRKQR